MAISTTALQQAASVVGAFKKNTTFSLGTCRNYTQALTRVGEYLSTEKLGNLRNLTPEQAQQYLTVRGQTVQQKTLDLERQAIQSMMRHVTGKMGPKETLPVIKSARKKVLRSSRIYTSLQVDLIKAAQPPHNALATALAYAAGLRAHELLTLRPITEQPIDSRPALDSKWRGREGVAYSVKGKGGLIREVRIPQELANALEQRRLQEPRRVTDREIYYKQYYDIGGGLAWSRSFSAASKRALGSSAGAKTLRDSYAYERLDELQRSGLTQTLALSTIAQERGHEESKNNVPVFT